MDKDEQPQDHYYPNPFPAKFSLQSVKPMMEKEKTKYIQEKS